MQECLNLTGLVFNILGVGLMFTYANPQPSFDASVSLGVGDDFVLVDGTTVKQQKEKERLRRQRYQWLSRIALSLLLIGFLFQFTAILVS